MSCATLFFNDAGKSLLTAVVGEASDVSAGSGRIKLAGRKKTRHFVFIASACATVHAH